MSSAHRIGYTFGRFRLIPSRQLLLKGRTPLRVPSPALAILTALVRHAGRVVSKKELLARVWPKRVVEATNLKVHVAALRRALGESADAPRYIETVRGKGYRFLGPVAGWLNDDLTVPATVSTQ